MMFSKRVVNWINALLYGHKQQIVLGVGCSEWTQVIKSSWPSSFHYLYINDLLELIHDSKAYANNYNYFTRILFESS